MSRSTRQPLSSVSLRLYGIPDTCLKRLHSRKQQDNTAPELTPYLDLLKSGQDSDRLTPDAVAEHDDRPLLYLIDRSRLSDSEATRERQLAQLRRSLACRGDRAWLAVAEHGKLFVVPVASLQPHADERELQAETEEAANFFPSLIFRQRADTHEPDETDFVHEYLFKLLTSAAAGIARSAPGVSRDDVLSLIGRALFFRFLRDRGIISDKRADDIIPGMASLAGCWANADALAKTCAWLDTTFNGDLLPLGPVRRGQHLTSRAWVRDAFSGTSAKALSHLQAIVAGCEPVGDHYQMVFNEWRFYDFGHVPAGLLSQVYESFSHKWDHPQAKKESVHYTPRRIAEWMTAEAFEGLAAPEKARVLDPACGAGVFLVIALRRLYQAQWRATGVQPDTSAIRRLLYDKLSGFDISESALRLAALGLYLTAIELDPDPLPAKKLRFRRSLRGTVLHFFRDGVPANEVPPGSLGSGPGRKFDRKFDLILANPPWTSVPPLLGGEFRTLSKDILKRRKLPDLAARYENPDNVPDLPFLLRSTEWCRPGGRIAMALHGRLFFKQEDIPRKAREVLLRALRVTGVINGSNLTDTKVWPNMHQPFVLLFASNEVPRHDYAVQWSSPLCDLRTNNNGDIIFDYAAAQPVGIAEAEKEPWLWKALAVGTWLDVEVYRRLMRANEQGLEEYWKQTFGKKSCGNGYMPKPGQKSQRPAYEMKGLPDLKDPRRFRYQVHGYELEPFAREQLSRPRDRDIYRAPLFLLKGFPGSDRGEGWALVAGEDTAYTQAFHGFSGHGRPEGAVMVRYLQLLAHSYTWVHYALMTSPKFGVERQEFYKSDLETFPLTPWDKIPAPSKQELATLSEAFTEDATPDFKAVDKVIARLHGLDAYDQQVIHDTVSLNCPYLEFRERAAASPSQKQRRDFCQHLQRILTPYFEVTGEKLNAVLHQPSLEQFGPWGHFSVIVVHSGDAPAIKEDAILDWLLQEAVCRGATMLIKEGRNHLLLCLRNQYRFWTPTRARLCASEIVRDHLDSFDI